VFEGQTYKEILQRLKSKAPSGIDSSEGSFIHDVLSPAALELAQLYVNLDLVLTMAFAQTTSGEYLDYRAGEHGIERKPAVKAAGTVTITGSQGIEIEEGQVFVTDGGIEFESAEPSVIQLGGTVEVDIQARNAGITGNVPVGAINKAQVALQGVTGIANESPVTGGTDEEADQDLLLRLLDKVRYPVTSGNVSHYLQWAREVTGIGDARVFPLWDGPGTVKIIIVDSEKAPAGPEAIAVTADYIESVRPVGAEVTVEAAVGVAIDAAATVTLMDGYSAAQVEASFRELLTAHLKETVFRQDYVSYAKIGSILLETPGILDHSELTVNGGTSNVSIGDTVDNCQVPIAGTVTLNE